MEDDEGTFVAFEPACSFYVYRSVQRFYIPRMLSPLVSDRASVYDERLCRNNGNLGSEQDSVWWFEDGDNVFEQFREAVTVSDL